MTASDRAFVIQEVINAATLNPEDLRCPHCEGNTLVLTGKTQVNSREVMANGVVVDRTVEPEETGGFDVTRIDCVPCSRTMHVRDPRVFELEKENLQLKNDNHDLRTELKERGGQPGPPLPGVGYRH